MRLLRAMLPGRPASRRVCTVIQDEDEAVIAGDMCGRYGDVRRKRGGVTGDELVRDSSCRGFPAGTSVHSIGGLLILLIAAELVGGWSVQAGVHRASSKITVPIGEGDAGRLDTGQESSP
jgi:hypothetical protein